MADGNPYSWSEGFTQGMYSGLEARRVANESQKLVQDRNDRLQAQKVADNVRKKELEYEQQFALGMAEIGGTVETLEAQLQVPGLKPERIAALREQIIDLKGQAAVRGRARFAFKNELYQDALLQNPGNIHVKNSMTENYEFLVAEATNFGQQTQTEISNLTDRMNREAAAAKLTADAKQQDFENQLNARQVAAQELNAQTNARQESRLSKGEQDFTKLRNAALANVSNALDVGTEGDPADVKEERDKRARNYLSGQGLAEQEINAVLANPGLVRVFAEDLETAKLETQYQGYMPGLENAKTPAAVIQQLRDEISKAPGAQGQGPAESQELPGELESMGTKAEEEAKKANEERTARFRKEDEDLQARAVKAVEQEEKQRRADGRSGRSRGELSKAVAAEMKRMRDEKFRGSGRRRPGEF